MSEHSEDLLLASARALDVTIYSRPGCHLCEAAKAAIDPLLAEFSAPLPTGAYIAAGFVLFGLTFIVNAVARLAAGGRVSGG